MKKTIAKILRKISDKLNPPNGAYLPLLSCSVGEFQRLSMGYQYPKGAQSLNFDRIRYRMAELLVKELLERRTILFTINDGAQYVNTIEATIYVKRPENTDSYEEI